MLDQLRAMQLIDLTVVNGMLREVYVNDIFPKEAKNNLPRVNRRIEARLLSQRLRRQSPQARSET